MPLPSRVAPREHAQLLELASRSPPVPPVEDHFVLHFDTLEAATVGDHGLLTWRAHTIQHVEETRTKNRSDDES